MSAKKPGSFLKRINLLSLSIPLAVLIANAVLPLRPIAQQAFMVIILVWLGIEMMVIF